MITIGVDEVGRGAWAGPLVVGAVALSQKIDGITDSKKLSKSSRERLDCLIRNRAEFIGLGWVSSSEVDDLGLTQATTLACERALEHAPKDARVIIDGSINYLANRAHTSTLINGDDIEPAISAASIVAKVARDKYMREQGISFPGYSFEKNVGYGTKKHILAIHSLGLTPLHRWSYGPIKDIFNSYET